MTFEGFAKVETIVVRTYNYRVNKCTFGFDYEVDRNGIVVNKGHYNSSHTRAISTMKKYLMEGYATELVLQNKFQS